MTDTIGPPYTETWLAGHDGTQFYTRTYAANTPGPRAVVLFVHGFAEHVGRYTWAHSLWAARGITLFAFDQRGFGRTALDAVHKSRGSAYGKTNLRDQMLDVEWWAQHLGREYPGVPLFLMGHSMGGGIALAFATRPHPPPSPEAVQTLSGIIASSPFLAQTIPVPRILQWVGHKAAEILPNMPYPAPVNVNDLSHDPASNKATADDPMYKEKGTLRGLSDMLRVGEQLQLNDYKNWPKELPVLILHGTADKVALCGAVEGVAGKLNASDKTLSLYPDGYHELVHEPDGVKEKFMDECISWVEARVPVGVAVAKL